MSKKHRLKTKNGNTYSIIGLDQFDEIKSEQIKEVGDAISSDDEKKHSEYSSKYLKDIQEAEETAIDAFKEGIDKLHSLTRESANKKEDGALVDLPINVAKSMSTTIKKLADIPTDLYEKVDHDRDDGIFELPTRVIRRITDIFYDED